MAIKRKDFPGHQFCKHERIFATRKQKGMEAVGAQLNAFHFGLGPPIPMGKSCLPAMRTIRSSSKGATPDFESPPKMSFKETKRRMIIAGLRAMRAPAALCPNMQQS